MQKYQTKEKVYEALGLTREEFIDSYNNPEKQAALLEQVELVLKGDK